jgi:hypothetical protein
MMTMVISGSDGVTFPDSTNQFSGGAFSFKNRIINGDCRISQAAGGAAVTGVADLPVDQFRYRNVTDGAYSGQQDSSAPVGFVNSIKTTITTADASIGATQYFYLRNRIEGTNVSDLGWGTANAKTVTLSFWVRSSLTGTFGVVVNNSGYTRSYPATYTISVADTWEYKTITVPGDTTGTWLTTTGIGLEISFDLGVGSTYRAAAGSWTSTGLIFGTTGATNVISTLNATWYVTGVQLEVGSVATPFERRPYGTELALCQRYYYKLKARDDATIFGNAFNPDTTNALGVTFFPVPMRVGPTALEQSGTASDYRVRHGITNTTCSGVPTIWSDSPGVNAVTGFVVASGLTAGQASFLRSNNSNAFLAWSAEL